MFKRFVIVILFLISAISANAANYIYIDKDCISLTDIFPEIGIKEDLFCGMDYGQEKTINRQMALYIINKYNIKGAQPGEATFKRRGVLLTEDRLKDDIKNQLSMMYPDLDVEVSTVRLSRDFYIPENMQYKIDIPQNRFGNISISLDNGVKKYSYSISLTAYKNVYITTDMIKKDDDVAGKVTLVRTDLSRVHGDLVTDPKGYIAKINISAGRPLTTNLVDKKPDALKDSSVTIVYRTGNLEINASGKLDEDAYEGKIVRVENSESGKVLRGEYQSGRKVIVNVQ